MAAKKTAKKTTATTTVKKVAPKQTKKSSRVITKLAVAPSVPRGLATGGSGASSAGGGAPPAGAAEAYDEWLPVAQALGAAEAFRISPAIAYRNVQTSLAALAPHTSVLADLPPPFSLTAMGSVLAIAQATVYAAAQIDLSSPGTTKALVETATGLREILMASAVAMQKAGTLDAASVSRIVKGRGPRDIAQDCIDLARLFTTNAATVKGKTPVTAQQIQQASAIGNQLLGVLRPKGTKQPPLAVRVPAVAARDALGALLTQQYEQQVRRAGMWIWLDEVDQHVPPLGSHVVKTKKEKTRAAAKAAPATTPA